MKWLVSASLTLLILSPIASAQGKPIKDNPYYPLQIGNTWTYKAGDAEFILKVVGTEMVAGTQCVKIDMSSISEPTKVLASEKVCVKDDGVYRYSFGDKTPDKPIRFLKLPLKKGETWEVDTKALGEPIKGTFKLDEAEIKIGGTTYKTFTATSEDMDVAGMKLSCTFYFAENVGLVKQVIKSGGQQIDLELKKFEAGGGGVKK